MSKLNKELQEITMSKLGEIMEKVHAMLAFDVNYDQAENPSHEVRQFASILSNNQSSLYRVAHAHLYTHKELCNIKNALQLIIATAQDTVKDSCVQPVAENPVKPASDQSSVLWGPKIATEIPAPDGSESIDWGFTNRVVQQLSDMWKSLPTDKDFVFTVLCRPDAAVKLWGKPTGGDWFRFDSPSGRTAKIIIAVTNDRRVDLKEVKVVVQENGYEDPKPLQFGSFDFDSMATPGLSGRKWSVMQYQPMDPSNCYFASLLESLKEPTAAPKGEEVAKGVDAMHLDYAQQKTDSYAARQTLLEQLIGKKNKSSEQAKPPLGSFVPENITEAVDNLTVVDGSCVLTGYTKSGALTQIPLTSVAREQLAAMWNELWDRMFRQNFRNSDHKTMIYTHASDEIFTLLSDGLHDEPIETPVPIEGYPAYRVFPHEPCLIQQKVGFFRINHPLFTSVPSDRKALQVYGHLYRMVAGTCKTISDPMYDDLYSLYARFVLATEQKRLGASYPYVTPSKNLSKKRQGMLLQITESLRNKT